MGSSGKSKVDEAHGSAWADDQRNTIGGLVSTPNPVDDKGRTHVRLMSERELLEEAVTRMRATQDLVETFIESMSRNPMLRSMAGMFGKLG